MGFSRQEYRSGLPLPSPSHELQGVYPANGWLLDQWNPNPNRPDRPDFLSAILLWHPSHTQAGLMVFSCHYAQGLVDLEMLSYQYNFTSSLKIVLAINSLGNWSHSEDRPGSFASKTAKYPWRINASAAGGHSTQKVFRGSSCWPLQWVLLFLSFQSLSPTVAGNTMTSIWKTTPLNIFSSGKRVCSLILQNVTVGR